MSNNICIYHKGCVDGFGAAWAIKRMFDQRANEGEKFNLEFHPANYGSEVPDVKGKHVYVVDFSYKRPEMDSIIEVCESLVILDHHKTAEAELEGIFEHPKVSGMFNMAFSGAALAWAYYHDGLAPPKLIKHIEDRDLWKFDIPGTREIIAALYSHPQDFELWDTFMTLEGLQMLRGEGCTLLRQHNKNVQSLIDSCARDCVFGGHEVLIANAPYMFASDMGNEMAKGRDFSVTYYDSKDKKVFSLRSDENGVDVSAIAATYGGGGHEHAAGFQIELDEVIEVTFL